MFTRTLSVIQFQRSAAATLHFYLNDQPVTIPNPDPSLLLLDYLRSSEVGLTGAKKGCGQGGCGACTVMLARYDTIQQKVHYEAINSCLRPLCSLDGMSVITIEGVGSVNTSLSPVQYRIAKDNGSQCGYCTPGFVMNMQSFLAANRERPITKKEIEDLFDGNICRCTGFRPILYAMKSFASDWTPADEEDTVVCEVDPAVDVAQNEDYTPEFPTALMRGPRPLYFAGHGYQWYRPLDIPMLFQLLRTFKDTHQVRFVVGNTSIGVYDKYTENPHILIDISHIEALYRQEMGEKELVVGAAATYHQFLKLVEMAQRTRPTAAQAGLETLHYMARRTAGTLVRNAASLAGNTMLVVRHIHEGEPFPSDMFTALCTLGAEITVFTARWRKPRRYTMLAFADAYHSDPVIAREGIILSYHIPYTRPNEYVRAYKVARRQVNAHSIVNAGFRVQFNAEQRVSEATIILGGIAPIAFHATATERYLRSKRWTNRTLTGALQELEADIAAAETTYDQRLKALEETCSEGFTPAYKRGLATAFLYQFFVHVAEQVAPGEITASVRLAGYQFERPVTRGTQTIQTYPEEYPISLPIIKLTAFLQATGEAKYTHDLAVPARGLQAAFVTSRQSLASFHYQIAEPNDRSKRVSIDELLKHLQKTFPGVVDYITARDVPGPLLQGSGKDDPLFCNGEVTCFGQSIGLVVATTEQEALDAAHYLSHHCLAYQVKKPILTLQEAIAKNSIFVPESGDDARQIIRPGSQFDWLTADGPTVINGVRCMVVSGKQETGAQIHFYMETQATLAEIGEQRELILHSSSQSPNSVQQGAAATLKLPTPSIDVRIGQLGGAYGGKTTRSPFVASAAAVATWKLRRPVRVAMPRDVDTMMIGKRHPFYGEYKIAIASDGPQKGKIMGMVSHFWSDGGNTIDCSFDVMDCAVLGADNAYNVPNFRVEGNVCRTNKASSGAMRSYGMIQSVLIQEDAIEAAAYQIGLLPEEVRGQNLYQLGDLTPFGQELDYCYLNEVWDRLMQTADFKHRQEAVNQFNQANRWRKRGISMVPLKYGLGYNLGFLQQGGALIDVYASDGHVLVQHGGIEMGQGIMTKMAQVASYALNLPLGYIQMTESNTNVIANPVSTGATSGSDLNGGAIKLAGDRLRRRLEQFVAGLKIQQGEAWCIEQGIDYWNYPEGWQAPAPGKAGDLIWHNIIGQAYQHRIDLSEQALFHTSGLKNSADLQFYGYTYSAACTEVEIDVLTGVTNILRADVLYDMGKSLNPAIDIGQIEGAFVMGAGNVLTEEVVYQMSGKEVGALNTVNTWRYKPPATSTIPIELHTDLFPRDAADDVKENPHLLMSSKGVGEPPLVLAASVYFAVKQAVLAARQDRGRDEWFYLPSPATVQRVREACLVEAVDLTLSGTARQTATRKTGSVKAVNNHPRYPVRVWAEPDEQGQIVLNAITAAAASVDIVIYELGGPKILAALQTAKQNGVDIRILFNGQFFTGNDSSNSRFDQTYAVIAALQAAPGTGTLAFHWSSNNFNLTHQKTILIDTRRNGQLLPQDQLPESAKALVMTLNLSAFGWQMSNHKGQCIEPCQFWGPGYPDKGKGTRDFGVVLTAPSLVATIATVFESDFNCTPTNMTNGLKDSSDELVWSNGTTGIAPAQVGYYPADGAYPMFDAAALSNAIDEGNARAAHLAIINGARTSLLVYNEEMDDDEIVAALVAAARRGVAIQVIMTGGVKEGPHGSYWSFYWNFDKLAQAGTNIRLFPSSAAFMYIHAKVLLADYGKADAAAFMGSQNISGSSLNFNRELGVILTGSADTQLFYETFQRDWQTEDLIQWPSDGHPPVLPDSGHKTNADGGPPQVKGPAPATTGGVSFAAANETFIQPLPCGPIQPRTNTT